MLQREEEESLQRALSSSEAVARDLQLAEELEQQFKREERAKRRAARPTPVPHEWSDPLASDPDSPLGTSEPEEPDSPELPPEPEPPERHWLDPRAWLPTALGGEDPLQDIDPGEFKDVAPGTVPTGTLRAGIKYTVAQSW